MARMIWKRTIIIASLLSLIIGAVPVFAATTVHVLRSEDVVKSRGEEIVFEDHYGPLRTLGFRQMEQYLLVAGDPFDKTMKQKSNFFVLPGPTPEQVTYRVFVDVTYDTDVELTPDLIAETQQARQFLSENNQSRAEATIERIQEDTQDLLNTQTARDHPNLANNLQSASNTLVECIEAHPDTWIDDCASQYDAYDAAVAAFTDALVTDNGTVGDDAPPPQDQGALTDCTTPAGARDILCSPVNLIVSEDDPNARGAYIARLLSEGIGLIFRTLLAGFSSVAATFAVVALIYGAFLYVTSHGNEEQITKAKQFIIYTLIGLVVLSLTYVIISAVRDFLYVQPPV